jgi:hypothetical protein
MTARKNVSFNGNVRVQSVPSMNDLSIDERRNSWFSIQDYDRITSRERRLVRKATEIGNLRDVLGHEIGLQSRLEQLKRRKRVQNGVHAVLLEQERLWLSSKSEATPNHERLASVSSHVSQESLLRARSSAMDVVEQLQNCPLFTKEGGRFNGDMSCTMGQACWYKREPKMASITTRWCRHDCSPESFSKQNLTP